MSLFWNGCNLSLGRVILAHLKDAVERIRWFVNVATLRPNWLTTETVKGSKEKQRKLYGARIHSQSNATRWLVKRKKLVYSDWWSVCAHQRAQNSRLRKQSQVTRSAKNWLNFELGMCLKFVSGSDVQRETRIVLAAVFPHFIGTYKSNGIFNTCWKQNWRIQVFSRFEAQF